MQWICFQKLKSELIIFKHHLHLIKTFCWNCGNYKYFVNFQYSFCSTYFSLISCLCDGCGCFRLSLTEVCSINSSFSVTDFVLLTVCNSLLHKTQVCLMLIITKLSNQQLFLPYLNSLQGSWWYSLNMLKTVVF